MAISYLGDGVSRYAIPLAMSRQRIENACIDESSPQNRKSRVCSPEYFSPASDAATNQRGRVVDSICAMAGGARRFLSASAIKLRNSASHSQWVQEIAPRAKSAVFMERTESGDVLFIRGRIQASDVSWISKVGTF
jgi:hypothetical protein